jgi:SAM-dependent methyltransferase
MLCWESMTMNKSTGTNTVVHRDLDAEREWRKYVDSGLGEAIRGYGLVNALFACVNSGLSTRLSADPASLAKLADGLDAKLVEGLLRFLAIRGVVAATGEPATLYALTDLGRSYLADLAYSNLGFYREAYGQIFDNLGPLLSKTKTYPKDVERDGAALARHCATGFHYFGTNVSLQGLAALGAESFLDLGCGGAGFLIDACRARPNMRAVGLDISKEAIELARQDVAAAGLENRIQLFVGDAFQPQTWPAACREVEAITTFGALHEQFREGEGAVVELLNKYAALTTEGPLKGLLVGEPELLYDRFDADFYLVHVFTNQGIPRPREGWLPVFEKSKLRCESVLTAPDTGPRFAYYLLRPREK